jgi:hypothetical protein
MTDVIAHLLLVLLGRYLLELRFKQPVRHDFYALSAGLLAIWAVISIIRLCHWTVTTAWRLRRSSWRRIIRRIVRYVYQVSLFCQPVVVHCSDHMLAQIPANLHHVRTNS